MVNDGINLQVKKFDDDKILFECSRVLSTGSFWIQVVKEENVLLIIGDRIPSGENYVIELSDEQVPLIMKEFDNDY